MRRLGLPAALIIIFITATSFLPVKNSINPLTIVVDKSNYTLSVFDAKGWLVTFPVVFGSNDLGDKFMEGDRKTPEGTFTIISKKVHSKWYRFMMLDYPTNESYEKFNQRREAGIIPKTAKIGGGIGIHGTWPHEDFAVDRYKNWTLGCISLRNKDVDELYRTIPVGTTVRIQK